MIENQYDIKTKPASPGNPQANVTIERLHQVLGNLLRMYNLEETYVDDVYPSIVILEAAAFAVRYTYHRKKEKSRANYPLADT